MLYRNLVLANAASLEAIRNQSSANEYCLERCASSRCQFDKTMQKIADSEALHEIANTRIDACLKQISEAKATMARCKQSEWLIGKPLSNQNNLKTFYELPIPEVKTGRRREFKKINTSGIVKLNSTWRSDQADHQNYVCN